MVCEEDGGNAPDGRTRARGLGRGDDERQTVAMPTVLMATTTVASCVASSASTSASTSRRGTVAVVTRRIGRGRSAARPPPRASTESEGEAEDEKTGGWGPASPKKKKSVARLGMHTANATFANARSPTPKSPKRVAKQARVAKKNSKKKTLFSKRRFPDATREALERAFVSDAKPGAARVARLESDLGLNQHQIKVWFQNRRRKEKA